MVLRLVRFTLEDGAAAQAIADGILPEIKREPGVIRAVVFGEASTGECGVAILWESQAHAEAAARILRPKLESLVANRLLGALDVRLFPVLAEG